MFKRISTGVVRYKRELRGYVEFSESLGILEDREGGLPRVSEKDMVKLNAWNLRLKGMEEGLGMTENDKREIYTQVTGDEMAA